MGFTKVLKTGMLLTNSVESFTFVKLHMYILQSKVVYMCIVIRYTYLYWFSYHVAS